MILPIGRRYKLNVLFTIWAFSDQTLKLYIVNLLLSYEVRFCWQSSIIKRFTNYIIRPKWCRWYLSLRRYKMHIILLLLYQLCEMWRSPCYSWRRTARPAQRIEGSNLSWRLHLQFLGLGPLSWDWHWMLLSRPWWRFRWRLPSSGATWIPRSLVHCRWSPWNVLSV